MSKKFLVSLDLNKNELLNARLQNLSSDPSSPVAGQIYYNTQDKVTKFYDGTQWVAGGSTKFGNTAARPSASKAGTLYIDTETSTIYLDNGTSWLQATVNASDVADAISAHNDLTTGVHGVSGDVVGTSDTQTLSNKTISDNLHFNAGADAGYIAAGESALVIDANDDLEINADHTITMTTNNGDIILNPDGHAYIGSAGLNNKIATIGDLESNAVVQSISGTTYEVSVSDDGSGNVTVGLPDDIKIADSLEIGEPGSALLIANAGLQEVAINGTIYVSDPAVTTTASIGIDGDNNLNIEAPGNLLLGGDVYVGTVASGNEVVTNAGTADISNKRIIDTLYFTDGVTIADEGQISILSPDHEFEIKANYGDLDLKTSAVDSDVNITSIYGNVNLNPNATGATNVNGVLNVTNDLNTTTISGAEFEERDGSLTLQDGTGTSEIHINGNTKNIELLPASGSKAFYGSAATAGNEIAKISDIQASSSGLSWKEAVNLFYDDSTPTLSGDSVTTPLVIDGHDALGLADAGYRILVANGDDAGIYVYNQSGTSWTLVRSSDADAFGELVGAAVFVMEGNQYGATSWVQNNHYLTNFTGQSWIQFSGQGTYIGSDSIVIDGNEINAIVNTDAGLDIDSDGIKVVLGEGLTFSNGSVVINAGTGFDTANGYLNFAEGYGVRKYTTTIGNNSATSFTVNHALGTRHVTVQLFEAASPYAQVEADVEHTDTNNVTVKFASAPTTGEFEVVIVG